MWPKWSEIDVAASDEGQVLDTKTLCTSIDLIKLI